MRPVNPVRSPDPANWLLVFIVAVSTLALVEVAISVQLLTEQKAAPHCEAAQLRASLASDVGASGEEDAMVELANLSPKGCALKGFPGLRASTLAHRPFALPLRHVYGPNETVEAYPFPAPTILALHHGSAAYFDLDFLDEAALATVPVHLSCVESFYVQVFLAGQRRPVAPPVLVYGELCNAKGHKRAAAVSPYEDCDPFDLPPPVTSVPRTASSWCMAPYT